MAKFKKCPRCEINYYDSEKQEYCDICLLEMKGKKVFSVDVEEPDEVETDEEDSSARYSLCASCGKKIPLNETYCEDCKTDVDYGDDDGSAEGLDDLDDNGWEAYRDDSTESEIYIEGEENFFAEAEEEEEEVYSGNSEDDFEEVGDYDLDDDDEEEDDEDDDY